MVTWNENWPEGTQSVKANQLTGSQNTTYVTTEMRLDHFWNEDANNDGHHRYVEMPKIDDASRTVGGGLDANKDPIALNTNQAGLIYTRTKTAAESPGAQYDEPFAYTVGNGVNQYMQLGFRALGHFTIAGGVLTQTYAHNCVITRNGEGLFTVTFSKKLPSANYIVFGDAIRNDSSSSAHGNFSVRAGASKAAVMTEDFCRLVFTRNTANTAEDPLAGWVAICGG